MTPSKYFIWFILYSCCGWLWETVYSIVRTGKWEERGFLFGPVCPIYGVCACTITFIDQLLKMEGEGIPGPLAVFAVSFFGSIVVEYTTSWGLEQLFHAYWWDYSKMPFNINGRVCLPASLLFAFAGMGVIYGTAPKMEAFTGLFAPELIEAVSLLVMAIMAADLALTVSALTSFRNRFEAANKGFNDRMENMVDELNEKRLDTMRAFSEKKNQLAGEILEGRERMEERRELLGQKVNETAVEPAMEYLEQMTESYRHALGRVKGFRGPKLPSAPSAAAEMNRALKAVKEWKRPGNSGKNQK